MALQIQVQQSVAFTEWLSGLKDKKARAKIADRIDRLARGNPGNIRVVGSGVIEMKIDFGPGYRVYYVRRGDYIVLLLCGGDKGSQTRDIEKAKSIALNLS
jgi:putative addiction module killer protein